MSARIAGTRPPARERAGGQAGRRIDGDRPTFETLGDKPVRLRLVWDVSDPGATRWRNEIAVGGRPFALVEEYRCTPI